MFYCTTCAESRNWPQTHNRSYGKCECCYQVGECYDLPSRRLTNKRVEATDEIKEIEQTLESIKQAARALEDQ